MKKVFEVPGTFESLHAAQSWLEKQGFSYGSLCRDMPVGIMKGDWAISKWKNLSSEQRKMLHGKMTSDDFREGPVTVNITILHEEVL